MEEISKTPPRFLDCHNDVPKKSLNEGARRKEMEKIERENQVSL
jgi:hypothetical protein